MMKKILAGAASALLLACYISDHALAAYASEAVAVRSLDMPVKNVWLEKGESRTITVSVSPGKADDKSLTWSSSDISVATVQAAGSDRASVKAVGEGRAKITATSHNGKTAVCSITVSDDEIEVRRIEMTVTAATIKINQIKTLSVEFFPRDADDKSIMWESNNEAVATVEDNGMVTGIRPGTAEITATSSNGKTATCLITVLDATLTEAERQAQIKSLLPGPSETISSVNASMTAGKTRDLTELIKYRQTYKDDNGDWVTQWRLTGTVSWASSNPGVVSVSDRGVASAHKAGTARVTATGLDNTGQKRVQTIFVSVTSKDDGSPSGSFEVSEGAWLDLSRLAELYSGTKDIRWSSSSPDIASVDSAGLAAARSVGLCTLTAFYTDKDNTARSVQYRIRVTAAILADKIKNSSITLRAGDEIDLGKMYYPNFQKSPAVLNQYFCTTSAVKVLSADGLTVSAKAAGSAAVTVRRTSDTGEAICHKLTVTVIK